MPYELRRRRNNASVLHLSAGDSNEEEEEEDADEPMTAEDLEFFDDSHVDEGNFHNQLDVQLSLQDENAKKKAKQLEKARKNKAVLRKTRNELAAAMAASIARVEGANPEAEREAIIAEGSGPEKPAAAAERAVRRGRMTNAKKVHLSEFHPELTCWSCSHTQNRGDVHAAHTIETWQSWLEKCERGIGRLERGEGEDQFHLQALVRNILR